MSDLVTVAEIYDRRRESTVERIIGGGAEFLDRLEAAIGKASREAISYLAERYGDLVPQDPASAPEVLKDHVVDAAIYHAVADHTDHVPEDLQADYARVIGWYQSVVRFTASIQIPLPPAESKPHLAFVRGRRPLSDQGLAPMRPWSPGGGG